MAEDCFEGLWGYVQQRNGRNRQRLKRLKEERGSGENLKTMKARLRVDGW
jgi:hypothetical protein